tara:strand:+ start:4493 stop:5632 length:1140 start_codon:yes stop_codon:yes gene_type:complete
MNPTNRSKTKEFNKPSPNLKSKEIKRITKLLKKKVYPSINLKMHHNSKYSETDFLDLLTYVAITHDFTNNGSKTFELLKENTPASNTVIHHIKKLDSEYVEKLFMKTFDKLIKEATKYKPFRKRVDLAIDITEQMYYGDKNDYMVCETKPKDGTSHCFRYITINVVENGKRFTLLALPMHKFTTKAKVVRKLIEYAKSKVKIRYVYLDRGFFNSEIINLLKELKVKFLMPAIRNVKIQRFMREYKEVQSKIIDYDMGYRKYNRAEFKLVFVNDKQGVKRVFATNIVVAEELTQQYFSWYSKRWGIETSYRVKGDFKARTTSKYYSVRLFYFMWSVCLYNIWVLVSLVVAIIFHIYLKKPLVTAKLFGAVLYSSEPRGIT